MILTNGYTNWGGVTCPVNEFYSWALQCKSSPAHDPSKPEGPMCQQIFNTSAVDEWARETAECVFTSGFDGILQDMEGIGGPLNGSMTPEKAAITYAVCALKREMKKTNPGALQFWTTDTGGEYLFTLLLLYTVSTPAHVLCRVPAFTRTWRWCYVL